MVCVCVCELESPWVLFVLIKQQLHGTLDTLDQTPSHYWNITLSRRAGGAAAPHVDASKLQQWVCLCVPACIFTCVFDVNSSMCVYSACYRSPFTIVWISSRCAGGAIGPPAGALDMWICGFWHLWAVWTWTSHVCLVHKSPKCGFEEQGSVVEGLIQLK